VYVETEHTADYSICITAPALHGVFEQAVQAVRLLSGIETQAIAPGSAEISIAAADLESLLIAWIEELLFLIEVKGKVWTGVRVEVDGFSLQARVDILPVKHQARAIKAVTYHGLAVTRKIGSWQAELTFDV